MKMDAFGNIYEDDPIVGHCAGCGDPIHASEEHYALPDGEVVCMARGNDCLLEWAAEYTTPGVEYV